MPADSFGVLTAMIAGMVILLTILPTPTPPFRLHLFSCPPLNGITFQFPVYPGWGVQEPVSISPNECVVTFNPPKGLNLYVPMRMVVEKEFMLAKLPGTTPRNPQGIYYLLGDPEKDEAYFQLPTYAVTVRLLNPAVSQGISLPAFMEAVINSFRAP